MKITAGVSDLIQGSEALHPGGRRDPERDAAWSGRTLSRRPAELDVEEQRQQVLALATDFPRLWRDPGVPQCDRKRMSRLLLEDVALMRADEIVAHVRFRGGATHSLQLPLPLSAAQLCKVDPAWSQRRASSAEAGVAKKAAKPVWKRTLIRSFAGIGDGTGLARCPRLRQGNPMGMLSMP